MAFGRKKAPDAKAPRKRAPRSKPKPPEPPTFDPAPTLDEVAETTVPTRTITDHDEEW